jgi:hypothetical protein
VILADVALTSIVMVGDGLSQIAAAYDGKAMRSDRSEKSESEFDVRNRTAIFSVF